MPLEIERKYLVRNDGWRTPGTGTCYRQGYLSTEPGRAGLRHRRRHGVTVHGPDCAGARNRLIPD